MSNWLLVVAAMAFYCICLLSSRFLLLISRMPCKCGLSYNSLKVPNAWILPSFSTIILSVRCKKSMACVTRIRVFYLSMPWKTCEKIFFLTLASRADIGSSIMIMSVSA